MLFGDLVEAGQDGHAALVQVTLDHLRARTLQIVFGAVLARQETAGQGEIADHAQAEFLDHGFQLGLVVLARVQVVVGLQALVGRHAQALGDLGRFAQALAAVIGGADHPHLALFHQPGEGVQGFLQRGVLVVAVRLVEVDAIGLQALERGLHRLLHIAGPEALATLAHVHAQLGGQDHLVALAAAGEPLAQHGLGFAAAVAGRPARIDVGGVDEIQARFEQGVQHAKGLGFVQGPAEDVATKAERRYLEV